MAGESKVEIGVHCIGGDGSYIHADDDTEHMTDSVRSALSLVVEEFKPKTWVDHGGRECLWESGRD